MAYIDDEGIMRLRLAILAQAVDDYLGDLKRVDGEKAAHALERFFLGEWGQWLSNDKGELIVARCKAEIYGKGVKNMEVITVKIFCPSDSTQTFVDRIEECAEQHDALVADVRREPM